MLWVDAEPDALIVVIITSSLIGCPECGLMGYRRRTSALYRPFEFFTLNGQCGPGRAGAGENRAEKKQTEEKAKNSRKNVG